MDFGLSDEQRDIRQAAREFAEGEFTDAAREFDREERFDLRLWRKACELGFVGVFIDEAYDGAGLGYFEHCLITEEFWRVDPGCGQSILSTTFGSELLSLFASEEQKRSWLPRLVQGSAIMGTAITEPDAGSDIRGAATRAVREGDEYVISGSKMFITNGTLAHVLLVFCLTDPSAPDPHRRHSTILVETDRDGFEANKIRGKLGIRASDTAEVAFRSVRVPVSNRVGEEGEGFRQVLALFNRSRLHICAQGVGLAQGTLDRAIRHVKNRKQFGKPLASFQAIRFKVAELATYIEAGRNLYYKAAWKTDRGMEDPGLIAMAKWFCGELAVRAADECVQMHGGYGYIHEYDVERFYRDAKILEIYEGTKEIEKEIAARTLLGKF